MTGTLFDWDSEYGDGFLKDEQGRLFYVEESEMKDLPVVDAKYRFKYKREIDGQLTAIEVRNA